MSWLPSFAPKERCTGFAPKEQLILAQGATLEKMDNNASLCSEGATHISPGCNPGVKMKKTFRTLKECLMREENTMPQSLSCVMVHLIFSTKDRCPFLDLAMASRVHAYIATVLRDMNSQTFRVGGIADHVHIACTLPRTICQSDLVKKVKITSSQWVKEQGKSLFSWQHGYGIFSVSKSHLDPVLQYIDDQEKHHRTKTFQEEFRAFLEKYQVEYDERYVWDWSE